jgi:hypothetical protein
MESASSALASLRFKLPDSFAAPRGLAADVGSPMSQAIVRFGLPVVPPEYKTPLEKAHYLLRAAAEIEHGLLVQYLYAAYSVDTDTFPALIPWRTQLANIAIQEMDHLLCVQNLIRFLDKGVLHVDRANFPVPANHLGAYPFPFSLEPLSVASLNYYVTAESPFPLPPNGLTPPQRDEVMRIWQDALKQAGKAGGKTLGHVGLLYLALYWLFCPETGYAGPWPNTADDPFPTGALEEAGYGHVDPKFFKTDAASVGLQGVAQEFLGTDGPTDNPADPPPARHRVVWTVNSAELARACIYQIAAQGEGVEFALNSHFLEFFDLYHKFNAFSDPQKRPPVRGSFTSNPTVESAAFPEAARPWGRLFNNRYQLLLLKLFLTLTTAPGAGTPPADRQDLPGDLILNEMKGAGGIRGLTKSLTLRKAAPPFELPSDDKFFGLPGGRLPEEIGAVKAGIVKLIDQAAQLVDDMLAAGSKAAPTVAEQATLNQLKTDDAAFRAAVQ